MRRLLTKLSYANVTATLALFLGLGGGTYAAVRHVHKAPPRHVIKACYRNTTGAVRIVKGFKRCGTRETPISWNSEGRRGKRGAKGKRGVPGRQGLTGAPGAPGPKGDTGAAGAPGATGAQGPEGDTGPQGPQGDAGPAGPSLSAFTSVGQVSVSGTPRVVVQTPVTVPPGINALVATASLYFVNTGTPGAAVLQCSIGRDGNDTSASAAATATTFADSATIPLTYRFSGLSTGTHTVDVACQSTGGSPTVAQAELSVVGTG